MDLIDQIAILERALQEHIKDWERFFAGLIKVPPETDRERFTRRLRHLSEQTINRRSERFRFEQLQHRFMAYSQNWERLLREREEGRGVQSQAEASSVRRNPSPANESAPASVDKTEGDALFDRYLAAKRDLGLDVRASREDFEEQIAVQRQKIEERLGRKVRFEVQVENGRVRVVARKTKKRK
ncbi:MAG: MXAN_5187 C-terminal domain-containing protein [Thermoanaerobaculales bacterium]